MIHDPSFYKKLVTRLIREAEGEEAENAFHIYVDRHNGSFYVFAVPKTAKLSSSTSGEELGSPRTRIEHYFKHAAIATKDGVVTKDAYRWIGSGTDLQKYDFCYHAQQKQVIVFSSVSRVCSFCGVDIDIKDQNERVKRAKSPNRDPVKKR